MKVPAGESTRLSTDLGDIDMDVTIAYSYSMMEDDANTTRSSATGTLTDTAPMETSEETDTTSMPTSSSVDIASFNLPDSTFDQPPNMQEE